MQNSTPTVAKTADSHSTRVDVINTAGGRILCLADVRGAISMLNDLAVEHNAIAIIHSGDFGFFEPSSLPNVSDRTLRHLIQYSSLISPSFRTQLLATTSPNHMRELLASPPKDATTSSFGLSEFPKLLSGELRLKVPVYTVWGACEDVAILEKIRLAAPGPIDVPKEPLSKDKGVAAAGSGGSGYSIPNLTVLDEATTRVLQIGGIKLRLFGLGGAIVSHKLFDNGTGTATIAGGGGTMWTTMLQIGELVDTAQKVYDPTETRLLISHASPGREGLFAQLALVLKADLTLSAGLHFRYGVSYNEFSVQHDSAAYQAKLEFAKKNFNHVWDSVKSQVESVMDPNQKALMSNALAVANRLPSPPVAGQVVEENGWKNCWNWNLPDAAFGSLVLDIRDGRIGSELKSQGFNFAYRANSGRPATSVPTAPAASSAVNASVTPRNPVSSTPAPASAPSTSTPAASNAAPPIPAPTPAAGHPTFPSRNAPSPLSHSRAPSGPNSQGFNGPRGPRGDGANSQPQGAHRGFARGGWGSGGSSSDTASKKPASEAAASPVTETAPKAAAKPEEGASKPEAETSTTPSAPKDTASPSLTPAPGGAPTRQASGRHPRQQRTNSKEENGVSPAAGGESSGGENARSPLSGPDSRGRGRGRGRGGARGRGDFRGGARRGGKGEGEGGEASPSAPSAGGGGGDGATTPGGGHKAGANGGGW
ncbi:hypothetical protein MNV49_007259 [Pseudohyphozyma bogoriensis]|nr:hypothetical protein MNV49_007259 [Pseudohyphozyma bogoriensis]